MSRLTGYVGTGRRNATADLKVLVRLFNQVPRGQGEPENPLSESDLANPPTAIFNAVSRFQQHHRILNPRTKAPYGYIGPRGRTMPKLRGVVRAGRRRRSAAGVDVSRLSYARLVQHHLTSSRFKEDIGQYVHHARGTLEPDSSTNTCALRVSYALLRAGKRLSANTGSWKYKRGATKAWLTSTAKRIVDTFANGERITDQNEIRGRKGIIVFLGQFGYGEDAAATGHATLWNGQRCHFNDGYWRAPEIHFFETRP